jgi:hypothetical protein
MHQWLAALKLRGRLGPHGLDACAWLALRWYLPPMMHRYKALTIGAATGGSAFAMMASSRCKSGQVSIVHGLRQNPEGR